MIYCGTKKNVGLLNFILIQRYQKMQLGRGGRMRARKVLQKYNVLHNFILVIQLDTLSLSFCKNIVSMKPNFPLAVLKNISH